MRHTPPRALGASLAAALVLVGGACGDDDERGPTPRDTEPDTQQEQDREPTTVPSTVQGGSGREGGGGGGGADGAGGSGAEGNDDTGVGSNDDWSSETDGQPEG